MTVTKKKAYCLALTVGAAVLYRYPGPHTSRLVGIEETAAPPGADIINKSTFELFTFHAL